MNFQRIRFPFQILILIVTYGCSEQARFNSSEEIWGYLKDEQNGYMYQKEINDLNFTLLYKPTDVMVVSEIGEMRSDIEVEYLRKKYSKQWYFTLSISKKNNELLSGELVADREKYTTLLRELLFELDQNVSLRSSLGKEIKLLDYVVPRMYGMSKSTAILLVYPSDREALEAPYLEFTLKDLGIGSGELKFKIKTETLRFEPQLRFEQ